MKPKWMTNRDKKTEPKLGKFYCDGCDRDAVGKGQTCKTCGWRDKHNQRRKK